MVVATAPTRGGPAWSPGGKLIAFSGGNDRYTKLYLVRSDGRKVRTLLTRPIASLTFITSVAWSPNGKTISFEAPTGPGDDSPVWTYIVRPDGHRLKKLGPSEPGPRGPAWSPDGRKFIFRTIYRNSYAFKIVNWQGQFVRWIDISGANDYDPAWQPRP